MSATNSKTRPIIAIVIAVIIIVGLLSGYYTISTTPSAVMSSRTAASTQAVQTVNIGFTGAPDVTDTPGFMLWETFAGQLGLKVNVQYYDGDPAGLRAMLTGAADMTDEAVNAVVTVDEAAGNASGSYPVIMFSQYEMGDFAMEVRNSVTNWTDLAGQPIGTYGPGSQSGAQCAVLLTQHGIPASQQDCVNGGAPDARARALIAGSETAALIEPFGVVADFESGCCHILGTVPAVAGLIGETMSTTPAYMKAHPDVLTKMTEATLMADRWAHNETAFLQEEQLEFPGTNVTEAGAAWKIWMAMNTWPPDGALSYQGLVFTETYYMKTGTIKSFLDPKYWSDLSFQSQALAILGPYTGPALGYPDSSIPTLPIPIPGVGGDIGLFPGFQVSPFQLAVTMVQGKVGYV